MRKAQPVLAVAVLGLFLTGCFATHVRPLPEPPEEPPTEIRGIVVGDDASGERIEFERVDRVEWTDSTIVVLGVPKTFDDAGSTADGSTETRVFPLSSVTGVLVREIDANRTSIVIGAVGVGAAAIAALLFTGHADDYTSGGL